MTVASSSQTWSSGTVALTLSLYAEPVPSDLWERLGPVVEAIEAFVDTLPATEVAEWRPTA